MTSKTGKMSGTLKAAEVPADLGVATRNTERDEIQVMVDEASKKLHKAWQDAGKVTREALMAVDENGKPSAEWIAAAKQAYTVAKDDRSPLKSIIRRACLLFDKGVPVYGEDKVSEKDGEVTVTFTYGPPAVKPDAATTTDETPSGETPPASDASGDGEDAGTDATPDTSDTENPPDEPRGRRFGRS